MSDTDIKVKEEVTDIEVKEEFQMDVSHVEYLRECNSVFDEELSESKPKIKRSTPRVWQKVREFESPEEAEEYVSSKCIWKKSSTKHSREGTKVEYRCSAGKYRINECPAGLYLLYHSTNIKVSLFKTECEHDNHNSDPARGLSAEIKSFVKGQFEEGIQKPNAILGAIRRNKLPEPTKSKLISYLKLLRHEKHEQPTVSAGEIHTWCDERIEIPSDEDQPFVLDHFIGGQDLKIVLSTRRLLCNLRKSAMVQIDATYKLVWQGYPVMILGTSDKNKVFHPFGLAICKDEAIDDFTFIFRAFHKFDLEWKPSILLADGNEAITGGFVNVFGNPTVRIMCFFHVLKNLEKHFKAFKIGEKGVQMKLDIRALQTCAEDTSFLKATELFFSKWRFKHSPKVDACLQYFEEQWISKHSSWYEGAAPGYPSTNNGIEAINSIIKSEHTLRERLPVGQFLNNVLQLLEKWSKSRDPTSVNCVHFADVRSIPLHEWTTAYQWAMKNVKVLQQTHEDPDCATYLTNSSTLGKAITYEDVSTYEDTMGKWESFDEFQQIYYGTWKIVLNKKCLEASKCNCPYFSKHSICKHVLGMKIRLKLVTPPPQAKFVSMRQKHKRGRPCKVKRALLVD